MNDMTPPEVQSGPAPLLTRNPPRLPPGPIASAAMAPGTYLRLRREKAGWTLSELALVIAGTPADRPMWRERLEAIEGNPHHAAPIEQQLLTRLVEFCDIDPEIYRALVTFGHDPEAGLPCPQICTACGCTWNRACFHPHSMTPCHWRQGHEDRCSACPPFEAGEG